MRTLSRILLVASLLVFSSTGAAGDFKKGWNAYNSADYGTALTEWQDLADSGDVNASYGMGLLYGNGFGVDMNDDLALKYYGFAAEKGHAEAQFNLAVMHQNGWGVQVLFVSGCQLPAGRLSGCPGAGSGRGNRQADISEKELVWGICENGQAWNQRQ